MDKKKNGFLHNMLDKLDQKLEKKSKEKKCCCDCDCSDEKDC